MKRLLGGTGGGGGGSGTPGGSTTQVQFNDAGAFAGDADLTWNKTTNVLGVTGDVNLSDGGTYTTTLQTITPTAARTISLPDATGTVALVAGSSGQVIWNNAGVNAGVPSSGVSATGNITLSLNGAVSTTGITGVPVAVTGTWVTSGGTAITTKPQVLIEPTGTSSGAWSPNGTGLGVNAASGFTGRLLDLQTNGTSRAVVTGAGNVGINTTSPTTALHVVNPTAQALFEGSVQGSITIQKEGTLGVSLYSNAAGTLIFYNLNGNNERLRIKGNGIVNLSSASCPTYADNTAALAGGLVAGDVYKTSAGDLRITV